MTSRYITKNDRPNLLNAEVIVDDPLTSLTGWTSVNGSWTTVNGYLEQTNSSGIYAVLKRNSLIPDIGVLHIEVEVMFPATVAGRRAMIAPHGSGAYGGTHDFWAGVARGTSTASAVFQRGDQAVVSRDIAVFNYDEWLQMELIATDNRASVYLNGLFLGSAASGPDGPVLTDTLALVTYGGGVGYRDLRVSTLKI